MGGGKGESIHWSDPVWSCIKIVLVLKVFEGITQKISSLLFPGSPPGCLTTHHISLTAVGHQIQVEERSTYSVSVVCPAICLALGIQVLDPNRFGPSLSGTHGLLGETDSVRDCEPP